MDPCWRSLFYITVVCIAIVSAQDGGNDTANGIMYPEYPDCVNATCTVSETMSDCETVALDFTSMPTEVYSQDNVICLNKTRPPKPIYRLTGCPDTFSSTMERTEGVCKNKSSLGIDLFLNLTEMVVGLYDFTCFTQPNSSENFKSNYAIIVNDTNTYRDILVFVNGKINKTTNVNINEGDNLTIVARAVGEVTLVEVIYLNATGHPRTNNICKTNKACGIEYKDDKDDLESRDQLCTLTNAAASTDNQTLRFFVRNQTGRIELGEVNITVNPPPPSTTSTITTSPTSTGSPPNNDGSGPVVVIVVTIVAALIFTTLVLFTIVCLCVYYRYRSTDKSSSSQMEQIDGKSVTDGSKKLRVLIYSCDHFNIEPLVNKLKVNQEFEVEELIDDRSSHLSDNVSKLHSEISQGSVLIDCSCPGVTHSTMHTVVKSYTQKPSGDPDSNRWHIIQLNSYDTDVEIDRLWSKLYDNVEVMEYHTLDDDVIDSVERKLIDYSQSRTWSIHSSENELDASGKQHLLAGHHDEQRAVGASRQKVTNTQNDDGYNKLGEKVEVLVQKVDVLRSEAAEQHKELQDSLKGQTEQLEQISKQEENISKDTRTLVNNIQPSE